MPMPIQIPNDLPATGILQNENTSAYKFVKVVVESLDLSMEMFMKSMKYVVNIVDIQDVPKPVVIPPALESCIEVLNDKYTKGEESTILCRDKEKFKAFNPTTNLHVNANKCKHCIYCNLCDRTYEENVY